MVSAFFSPGGLDNPASDGSDVPRLVNTTEEEMAAIREYLFQVVKQRKALPVTQFTWQDIADLVVRCYASELSTMATDVDSIEGMEQSIQFLLEVFTDYSAAEEVRESEARKRCGRFYLQSMPLETEVDRLIYSACEAVNSNICATLFRVRDLVGGEDETSLPDIQDSIKSLMDYLSWSSFSKRLSYSFSPQCQTILVASTCPTIVSLEPAYTVGERNKRDLQPRDLEYSSHGRC